MTEKTIEEQIQELKDNIGNVPRQALEQILADLYQEVLEYRNCIVGNSILSESLLEDFRIVFDDEIILRRLIERHSRRSISQFVHLVNVRYAFAVTGAMRWPNSQEAYVHIVNEYKVSMH